MSSYGNAAMAEELVEKLSRYRSLDSSQTLFLRGVFLSLSDRPLDDRHIRSFIHAHYRDIPTSSRGALGQGVAELFAAEDRAAEEMAERKLAAMAAGQSPQDAATSAAQLAQLRERAPRITWKSFHRVCAALGLHLNERRGQASIKKLAVSEDNNTSIAAAPSSVASVASSSASAVNFDPGMSFDDFLIFYSNLSKHLSVTQELREVWRLLDEDLDGFVPLDQLRHVMVGMEYIAPTNTSTNSKYFYESNYKYQYSEIEKKMTSEKLVESMMKQHFGSSKDIKTDRINFEEFVEFMFA